METPHEMTFLSVLQHLLQIDANDVVGDVIWETVQKLVAGASVHSGWQSDAERLLADGTRRVVKAVSGVRRRLSGQCPTTCQCVCHDRLPHQDSTESAFLCSQQSIDTDDRVKHDASLKPDPATCAPPPAPPLPPPPPPPPPPAPGPGIPPPPPALACQRSAERSRTKLRTFAWSKLSASRVDKQRTIWTTDRPCDEAVDFTEMEQLFSVATKPSTLALNNAMPVERKKTVDQVNLLDSKRSLNVNIFLRQFRVAPNELVASLRSAVPRGKTVDPTASEATASGGSEGLIEFSLERLRGLQRILPEPDDIESLRTFDGDVNRLGTAERFYLELIQLPHYKFRVDSLMVEAEFDNILDYVLSGIDAIQFTATELRHNKLLAELLHMVLAAGNFLNAGSYGGDAAGFKLSSLLKLSETRANKPGFTLLHFVAQMAARKNQQLLTLPDKTACKEAVQYTTESLTSDVTAVRNKLKAVSDQLQSCRDAAFRSGVEAFLQKANKELTIINAKMSKLDLLRLELAEFFCEDVNKFRLDECIKTFHEFFEKFHKANQDNGQREIADEQRRRTTEKTQNQSSCATDYQQPVQRNTSSVSTPPVIVVDGDSTSNTAPTTNHNSEHSVVKRATDNQHVPADRQSRLLSTDGVDSDLLEFLNDASSGSSEFVFRRSGSQRSRRRSLLTSDPANGSRERVATPPTCAATPTATDDDDLPPLFSRGGPGRWSLRDRVGSSKDRSSPPSAWRAKYMATRAAQDADSSSLRSNSASRSISDEKESLLDSPEHTLEQRRQARRYQSSSPVTTPSDGDDRQPKPSLSTSGRLSPLSSSINDILEMSASSGNCLRRDQQIGVSESRLGRSSLDVDRTIAEVENTGKQIDSVISGATTAGMAPICSVTPRTQENAYQTASMSEHVATPERHRKRWGTIFDNDEEEETSYLQRSATLPRRWRCGQPRIQMSDVEDRMKEIPQFPAVQRSSPAVQDSAETVDRPHHSKTADSNSSLQVEATAELYSCGNVDDVQPVTSAPRTFPVIPGVSSVPTSTSTSLATNTCELEQPSQSDSPLTVTDEPESSSRPSSEEFDHVSMSSGSRDEGFESAVDSVSAGTSFFARSIDSLVLPQKELVVVDIDDFDEQSSAHNNTRSNESRSVAKSTVPVATVRPNNGSKVSGSNHKSSSSKSSMLDNLTARLTRPKKSTTSPPQTTSAPSNRTSSDGTKSSAFVRGSTLRTSMPASMRSVRPKKPTASTSANGDLLAPVPPHRTTSISDNTHTTRPSSVTSRQARTAPLPSFNEPSSTGRKPHADVTNKTNKQITQQSAAARGRMATGEQSKERDKARLNGPEVRGGRDKLVLYQVVGKSSTAKTPNSVKDNSKKQVVSANTDAHRTQRLVSFNTPQQSRTFWS